MPLNSFDEGLPRSFSEQAQIVEKSADISYEKAVLDMLPEYQKELVLKSKDESDPHREEYEKIREIVMPYILDPGAARNTSVTMEIDGREVIYSAPGTYILNRSGLISRIEEKYGTPEGAIEDFHAYIFDLQNFRASDKVVSDANGGFFHAADVMINKVSYTLLKKSAVVNETLKQMGVEGSVTPARYGGDEFVVEFEGVGNADLRQEILEYVTGKETGGIESLEGYYYDGTGIIKGGVKVKVEEDGTRFKEIKVPEEEALRQTFWAHMQNGVFQTEEDLKKARLSPASSANGIGNGTEKIDMNTLTEQHKELDEYRKHIESICGDDTACLAEQMAHFESFVRQNFYDRLLGAHVINMANLYKEFSEKPFSRIHVIDTKEIKEINGKYGLAQGDAVILDTWKKVEGVLAANEDLAKSVKVFRRGAMIVVAEYPEVSSSPEVQAALESITSVKFSPGEKNYEVGVASISKTVEIDGTKPPMAAFREFLDKTFEENDERWLERLIQNNINNLEIFNYFSENAETRDNLFWNYLYSNNRKRERVEKALAIVDRLKEREIGTGRSADSGKTGQVFECYITIRNYLNEALTGIPIMERS